MSQQNYSIKYSFHCFGYNTVFPVLQWLISHHQFHSTECFSFLFLLFCCNFPLARMWLAATLLRRLSLATFALEMLLIVLKFAVRLLFGSICPLQTEMPVRESHSSTHSMYRFVPSCIFGYRISSVPCPLRILTNKPEAGKEPSNFNMLYCLVLFCMIDYCKLKDLHFSQQQKKRKNGLKYLAKITHAQVDKWWASGDPYSALKA